MQSIRSRQIRNIYICYVAIVPMKMFSLAFIALDAFCDTSPLVLFDHLIFSCTFRTQKPNSRVRVMNENKKIKAWIRDHCCMPFCCSFISASEYLPPRASCSNSATWLVASFFAKKRYPPAHTASLSFSLFSPYFDPSPHHPARHLDTGLAPWYCLLLLPHAGTPDRIPLSTRAYPGFPSTRLANTAASAYLSSILVQSGMEEKASMPHIEPWAAELRSGPVSWELRQLSLRIAMDKQGRVTFLIPYFWP